MTPEEKLTDIWTALRWELGHNCPDDAYDAVVTACMQMMKDEDLRVELEALCKKWESVDHPDVKGWLQGTAREVRTLLLGKTND